MAGMSVTWDTALSSVMTNKRRVSALKSLGVVSVGDALTYYPFRVTAPVPARAVREARMGQAMAFAGVVRGCHVVPMNARRGYRIEALVDDSDFASARGVAGAVARLVFFSYKKQYVDWMASRLRSGAVVVVAGEPSEFNGQLQFTHPEVVPVEDADLGPCLRRGLPAEPGGGGVSPVIASALAQVTRPRPIYHASSRISSAHIHETILDLLRLLAAGDSADVTPAPEPDADGEASARLDTTSLSRALPDILPEPVRQARGLMHRAEALLAIHDPESVEGFRSGIATLRYEEAFVSQTALLRSRRETSKSEAYPCPLDGADSLRERFIASLPFALTGGQREVIDAIGEDMAQAHPMQRLLQGEVGSGKTVVALAAMLQAVGAGRQAVLVAPTQVLAEQHQATISAMVGKLTMRGGDAAEDTADTTPDGADSASVGMSSNRGQGRDIPVILLTGGMKLAARRKALAQAASGEPCIIVATHAVFSKTFQAPNLALVVIDEQHRFGVEQREALRSRGDITPHLLVMTATPIPRTAAMTWFGDLDLSWLTELPGGRKPIRTIVVDEADGMTMGRMFAHIRARVDAGERAYVVCARIDDETQEAGHAASEGTAGDGWPQDAGLDPYAEADRLATAGDTDSDGSAGANDGQPARPPLHTVAEIAERLQRLPQFDGVAFATLTGRDKDEDKQRVMAAFAAGDTPVLVATTVIEVGVDVKQASCIVIFDADRYGLSQLHQLRGRVGRGGTDSWAFLVSRAEAGSPAEQRLAVIRDSLDGAEIAQADLQFRGAGDVLGDAQSGGKSGLKLLRVVKDVDLIADARERAGALLEADPELAGEVQLAGAVLDFTRGNETFLTSS